ncbi:hypothetical protein [Rheinheimera sp.]|uniref:hypothetical protein n=1 Tax=Rheinheimera sp. TaxID=1869214 RepID=UPI003AF5DC4E
MINSLLMWLRELLPLVMLLSFALAWLQPGLRALLLPVALQTTLLLLPAWWFLDPLLSSLDGMGLDWSYCLLYVLGTTALLVAARYSQYRRRALSLSITVLCCIHLLNLSLFGSGLLHDDSQWQAIATGTALALGINGSIAVLWYYLLLEVSVPCRWIWRLVLALLCARQAVMAVTFATQLDVINPGPLLWDTERWLNESSELGYLLQALLGYEATPSLAQLLVFLMASLAVLLWMREGSDES